MQQSCQNRSDRTACYLDLLKKTFEVCVISIFYVFTLSEPGESAHLSLERSCLSQGLEEAELQEVDVVEIRNWVSSPSLGRWARNLARNPVDCPQD